MKPYQLRVIAEKAELDLKIWALDDFINNSPAFSDLEEVEQTRLHDQSETMAYYSDILMQRIEAFTRSEVEARP